MARGDLSTWAVFPERGGGSRRIVTHRQVAEGADASGAGRGLHDVFLLVFEVVRAADKGFRKVGGGEDEGHAQSLGFGFGDTSEKIPECGMMR
ncbi:MAG: hypothetical protein B7Z37_29830 [Verrucomicrobia bacterium 12-59-8]|nr:MAG: hypothetical protein B7Z37_29830 [Verrucomicrobia bacterium 12-59-8]